MIEYNKIINKNQLQILKNQTAYFKNIKFSFTEKYIDKLADLLEVKNAIQILAEENKKFVGYVAAYENKSFISNYLFLFEIFVNPFYQHKGIGTNLLVQIINWAKKKNLQGIIVETEFENIPAQKFYEKNGFARIANPKWNKGITYQLNYVAK